MTFKKTVGAYLTGWVIAQTVYAYITRPIREQYVEDLANKVAEKVEMRLRTQDGP